MSQPLYPNLPTNCIRLLSAETGSRAYNLALPSSDSDIKLVYTYRLNSLLGLDEIKDSIDGNIPCDYQGHELGKFCRLLLKGNPNTIELLFLREYIYLAPEMNFLINNRRQFLTQKLVNSYIGYAMSQLHLLEKGGYLHTTSGNYNVKWAYHLIRLLNEGLRIADGLEPMVWWPTMSPIRLHLMDIRNDKVSKSEVVNEARDLLEQLKTKKRNLATSCDSSILSEWLIPTRMKFQ